MRKYQSRLVHGLEFLQLHRQCFYAFNSGMAWGLATELTCANAAAAADQ